MHQKLTQWTRRVRPATDFRACCASRIGTGAARRPVPVRFAVLVGILLSAPALAAEGERPLPQPGGTEWTPLTLPRVQRETRYTVVRIDGVDVLRSDADCSASALWHRTPDLDLATTPWLRWSWRVDDADRDAADPRMKSGDDFAARVYVLFRFDPDTASIAERLRHALGRRLFGRELPGDAINYVFTSRVASGESWNNPYTEASKMVSMGSAPAGRFSDAAANVLADYRTLFGRSPPPVLGVALMSDADQGCNHATAWFGAMRFTRDEQTTGTPGRQRSPPDEEPK